AVRLSLPVAAADLKHARSIQRDVDPAARSGLFPYSKSGRLVPASRAPVAAPPSPANRSLDLLPQSHVPLWSAHQFLSEFFPKRDLLHSKLPRAPPQISVPTVRRLRVVLLLPLAKPHHGLSLAAAVWLQPAAATSAAQAAAKHP